MDRKEKLFEMLFDVLDELTEYETPDVIFDRIVEDFAEKSEYHMGQADTFKSMLDTFRHELPANFVPEAPEIDGVDLTKPPSFEELYGGMNEINRNFMSENQDILSEFIRSAQFPGKLDS